MQPYPGYEAWSRHLELTSSRTNLFYYDTGETAKPAVLLVHGLGDDADTWRRVFPLLAAGFRLVAPDLPGFGRSRTAPRQLTIQVLIDAILEVADTLSLQSPLLVGHSLGAMLSHATALQNPLRWSGLTLISGSLVAQETHLDPGLLLFLIPGLGEWSYTRLRRSPQAAYDTLAPYYFRLANLPAEEQTFLFQRVNERVHSDDLRAGYLKTLRSLIRWLPARQKAAAQFGGVKMPVRVLWGAEDHISPLSNPQSLQAALGAAARLAIIPETGHNLQQERPDLVAEAVFALGCQAQQTEN